MNVPKWKMKKFLNPTHTIFKDVGIRLLLRQIYDTRSLSLFIITYNGPENRGTRGRLAQIKIEFSGVCTRRTFTNDSRKALATKLQRLRREYTHWISRIICLLGINFAAVNFYRALCIAITRHKSHIPATIRVLVVVASNVRASADFSIM